MLVQKLRVKNWKCFQNQSTFEFQDGRNLIASKNGTGKTSILEAIKFALYKRLPYGFTMNTVRFDSEQPCTVELWLTVSGSEVYIKRSFGGSEKPLYWEVEGQEQVDSNSELLGFMSQVGSESIIDVMWVKAFDSSDIKKPGFLTETVLSEVLADPRALESHYKSEVNFHRRSITNIPNFESSDSIKERLDDLKSKLKGDGDSTVLSDFDEQIIKRALTESSEQPSINQQIMTRWLNETEGGRDFVLSKLESNLKSELEKPLRELSSAEIRAIKVLDEASHDHCALCGGEYSQEAHERNLELANSTYRDERECESLKSRIEFIKSLDPAEVERSRVIYKAQNTLRRFGGRENAESLLKRKDDEQANLWKEFDALQKRLQEVYRYESQASENAEHESKILQARERIDFLSNYIRTATASWTQSVLQEASSLIKEINPSYHQLFIDTDGRGGGTYHLIMEHPDNGYVSLPVALMSSGEQTMIFLSLLISIHREMCPESIMVFDESFAHMDYDNLDSINRLLSRMQTQTFIITHNKGMEL